MEVCSCAVKNRAVSNRNCAVAMRGGEQRNENDQSVIQTARVGRRRELDSVGVDGRACERKAKPVGAGANPLAVPHTRDRRADGWRRNGRKSSRDNQGDPSGSSGVHGWEARRTARRESERP